MKEYRLTDWLPTTRKEVELRGWDELDVILFSGDAYVDHPSFGPAIISRILEANGYEFPKEDEEDEQLQAVSGWVRHVPFLRHLPLEKQIIVLFILVAVFLALVIYFGSLVSSN